MNNQAEIKNEDEINLMDIVIMFIKRKWWFMGSILLVLAIGFIYVFIQPANHILTYQVKLNEDYSNHLLDELYPNHGKDINYLSLQNIPILFKSENVFRSVNNINDEIDYHKLRESDKVKISLNEETSIFNISVSNSDYSLAGNLVMTLISTFESVIGDKERIILNEILGKIEIDIKDLEDENNNIENTIIAGPKTEIDILYAELDKYIVDYNIGLSNRLEENKNSENVSFYNVIIPPNDISNKITTLQKEINIYEDKILENKSKIIGLESLKVGLIKEEDIILGRIELISSDPFYNIESDKLRNIAIVIVLSIIIGILFTFIINFLLSSKIKEMIRKK